MSDFFRKNEEQLDTIYDKLVKNRTAQARAMGYENYLELGYYRMNRNCYGKDEVEAFRQQIKEYFVPFAENLHDRRRQRLGLEKLSYIDEQVYFKDGNPAPTGTPEEIMAAGQKMYRELSPETAEFFDFMMENQLFDVLGRKTKKAGGYMTYLPLYHAPFIFANFNGTSGDVDVITHECGHAFQGYLAAQDPIREHADIGMETAEIHSMSMEFFTEKWMNLFFGNRAQDYVEMHLEDAAAFIPYPPGLRGRSFLRTGRLLAEAAAHLRLPSVLYRLLSGTDLRTTVQGEDGCRFYRGVEELSEAVQAVRQ